HKSDLSKFKVESSKWKSKFKVSKYLSTLNFELFNFHLYGSIRASFGVSTAATVVVPRRARLRLVVLLLRMCCLNALLRRNFPFFVRLKRLAAPRCVFSFGIVFSRGSWLVIRTS